MESISSIALMENRKKNTQFDIQAKQLSADSDLDSMFRQYYLVVFVIVL